MKIKAFYSIITILVFALTYGCSDNKQADIVKINNQIDASVRSKLKDLNTKLFRSIMFGDVKAVKALMSDKLIEKGKGKIDTLILSTAKSFSAAQFEVMDEFYTKHHVKTKPDTLFTNKGNANDYLITYRAANDEMYTSVMVSKGLFINCQILAAYGKYGDDWKINVLQIGEYSIDGKTAQDYFLQANKLFDSGQIIDACNAMQLTAQLATPLGDFTKYRNEEVMREFNSKILESANNVYKFPVAIKNVKTTPKIFSVSPKVVTEKERQGVFPLIRYVSEINLSDTVALKTENNVIQKAIGGLFLGIDKNNRYIFYQAVNAGPDGRTTTKSYGFVQKTANN